MQRIVDFIHGLAEYAEPLGGPGLALVAFLDSSFVSLPEVNDILIVALVIKNPDLWLYYAMMTTLGSIAGCYTLYAVGRKGGEALLRRRFKQTYLDRGLALFRKYGLLSVVIPSILPPPTPFKIFVLLAGVARVRPWMFILAIGLGRGFRYGGEALLAYLYGAQATAFITEHLPTVSLWVAGVIGVLGVAFIVWRRLRTPSGQPG